MCCNYQITTQTMSTFIKTLSNDDDVNSSPNDSVVINLINTLITFAITRLTKENVERCLPAQVPTQVHVTQYEINQSTQSSYNTVRYRFLQCLLSIILISCIP